MANPQITHNEDLETRLLGRHMYSITDTQAAEEILYMPDYHGDTQGFKKGLDELRNRNRGKRVYVVLSDISEYKERLELYQKFGVMDDTSLEINLIASQLDNDEEKNLYGYMKTIELSGGIDNYLSMISQRQDISLDLQLQKENHKKAVERYEELELEDRTEEIKEANNDEINREKEFYNRRNRIIEDSIIKYEGNKLIDFINYANEGDNETVFILGGGNHDSTSLIDYVKNNTQDGDKLVHNINNISGAIKLGEGENQYRFQLSGNVAGISHHAHNILNFTEEDYIREFPHMIEDLGYFAENFDFSQKDKIPKDAIEAIENSIEYQRLTNGGLEDTLLHRLLLHMEFEGKNGAMGLEDKEPIYPRLDHLGVLHFSDNYLLKDEKGYSHIDSGHLHSRASKIDDELMQNKSRAHISILGKNNRDILDITPTPLDYDLNEIAEIARPKLEKLMNNYAANDENYDEYELPKAA